MFSGKLTKTVWYSHKRECWKLCTCTWDTQKEISSPDTETDIPNYILNLFSHTALDINIVDFGN